MFIKLLRAIAILLLTSLSHLPSSVIITAGNGHQISFERLKDCLSGVSFKICLAIGYIFTQKNTADHWAHRYSKERATERATYVSQSNARDNLFILGC